MGVRIRHTDNKITIKNEVETKSELQRTSNLDYKLQKKKKKESTSR
jgi:hypothetical protein